MGKGKPTPYDGLVKLVGGEPRWTGEVRLVAEHLADPLRWRRPRRIFVNSMSDLFHESLTNEQIAAVFGVMAACPQHTFQILTKRAQRMREWFEWADGPLHCIQHALMTIGLGGNADRMLTGAGTGAAIAWPLPNVWLGVSVEDQVAADERIPELLATPAAVRFLSCEPLLGLVDLDMPRCDDPNHGPSEWSVADDDATPWCSECDSERSYGHWLGDAEEGISWVIAGCESGPGARPCDVAWLRSLRDQCAAAGQPFFCKQAVDVGDEAFGVDHRGMTQGITCGTGSRRKPGGVIELPYLDGVQHCQFPEARHG